MADIVMDAGDGTHRIIEADAIRALIGFVEQRDGTARHERGRGEYGDGTASYPGDPGRENERPTE